MINGNTSTPIQVLLIDNDPDEVFKIREIIRDANYHIKDFSGFNLTHFERLDKALRFLSKKTVDISLVSPYLSNGRILKTIKQVLKAAPNTPLITICSNGYENLDLQVVQAGAQDALYMEHIDSLGFVRAIHYAIERKMMEMTLRESEKRYRSVTQSAVDGIIDADASGNITSWNHGASKIFGYSEDEALGQQLNMLMPKKYQAKHISGMERIAAGGEYHFIGKTVELEGIKKDGVVFPIELSLSTWETAHGQFFTAIVRDISKRKHYETAQIHERDRAQEYLDIAGVIIVALNNKGEVTLINRKGCEILGYEQEEIIRKDWFDNFVPDNINDQVRVDFERLMAGEIEAVEYYENSVKTKKGEERIIAWHNTLLEDDDGKPIGTLSSGEDITERLQIEAELQNSHNLLQAILEGTPNAVFVKDHQGKYVISNPARNHLLGLKEREVLGENDAAFYPPDIANILMDNDRHIIESGEVQRSEDQIISPDGQKHYFSTSKHPWRDDRGNVIGVIGIGQEITERVQYEESLRKSEDRYRSLVENAPIGIYRTTPEGQILDANPTVIQMLGYSSFEELAQRDLESEGYEPDYPRSNFHKQMGKKGEVRNLKSAWKRKDKSVIYVRESATAVRDSAGEILYYEGTVEDISEQKQAEQAQKESEEIFSRAFHSSPLMMAITRLDTAKIFDVNRSFTNATGYSRSELLGQTTNDLGLWAEPGDREKMVEQIKDKGRVQNLSVSVRLKNREIREMLFSAEQITVKGEACLISTAIDITERLQTEQEILQRTEDLAMVNTINAAVNRGDSIKEIFHLLVEETKRIFDNRNAAVYLVSQDRKYLELQNLATPPAVLKQIEKLIKVRIPQIRIPLQEGSLSQQLLLNNEPSILNDPDSIQKWMLEFTHSEHLPEKLRGGVRKFIPKIYQILGDQSILNVPMASEGEPIGLLEITRSKPFTEEEAKRFAVVAGQMTVAIRRVHAEKALQESEERYRLLFNTAPYGIDLTDLNGKIIFSNSAHHKMMDYAEGELIGKYIWELVADEQYKLEAKEIYRSIIENQPAPTTRYAKDRTKEGRLIDVQINWDYIRDAEGKLEGIVSIISDISDRVQAESKLRESEARFRDIFEGVRDAILVESLKGDILDVNQAACEMYGYTHSEFLTKNVADLVPDGEYAMLANGNGEGILPNHPVETVNIHANGKQFPVEISGRLQAFEDEEVILIVARDISSRKQAEDQIHLQSAALEAAANAIMITNDEGNIQWANQAFSMLTGYMKEEILDQNPRFLKSGQQDDAFYQDMWYAITAGQVWQGEVVNKRKDGTLYYEEMTITPIEGMNGGSNHYIAIKQDISERKQTERTLQRNAQEFEVLYETASDLAGERDLDILLDTIISRAKEIFNSDVAGIYLYDARQDELEMAAATGYDVNVGTRLRMGEGMAGKVAQSREPLIVDDYRSWEGRSQIYENVPFTSVLEVPMMYAGELIGVLVVNELAPKTHKFTDADTRLLSLLASSAAGAVRNAHHFKNAERRLERLSSLRNIDQAITSSLDLRVTLNVLLGHVLQQLEIDAAAVLLYRPELQTLEYGAGQGFRTQALQATNLRLGQGFAGQTALKRQIVYISDKEQFEVNFQGSPRFKSEEFESYIGVPLVTKGDVIGVLEIFHRQLLDPDSEWMTFLETLAGQAAIAIDNITLFRNLQITNDELIQAYDATIEGWSQALDIRDDETEGHSQRVTETTLRLAKEMGISGEELIHIHRGALLHDIGKIGVPDSILLKNGPLTDEEWSVMRQHPTKAFKILSPISYLQPALDIPYCHHEKWDGTGYPRGLKGEQIPLAARIFAIVDVYDALTSDRPYRKAWPKKKALDYIREQFGEHFDPTVGEAFLKLIESNTETK